MEAFLETVGWLSLVLLVGIGLLAGWLASEIAGGRHRGRYLALGVAGAVAAPLILAVLGVTVVAAGGVLAILLVAAVGALIVLALARALFG